MVCVLRLIQSSFFLIFSSLLLAGCGGAPGTVGSDDLVAKISFVSATPDYLTLAGQGGVEQSVVSFKVTDQYGAALSGVGVTFELSDDVGGARLSTTRASTGFDGEVNTVVSSGTAPVALYVTATIDGTHIQSFSDEISISTSGFSASSFSLSVIVSDEVTGSSEPFDYYGNPYNPVTNGSLRIESAGELGGIEAELQMIVTDQFGHKVRDGAKVTIVSPMSGLVRPSACIVADGICQATWTSTSGSGYGIGDHVILLAYASGAESFDDVNGNNIFDEGEQFVDFHEAFADENFNGMYDLGEFFVDANSNGVFDAVGNGVWDGPCLTDSCAGQDSTIIWNTLVLELGACPDEGCSAN
ncbi:Ig-like domain-containing protein [Teredinibacter turnerae]|uniref:Ig-like domain-containing protein n=1 Tax=Teredinibacter turnerae TaxID=2426 RepID=UPI000370EF52|nr:Ig-like domain-containing protein [Teredinibacter turnerae]